MLSVECWVLKGLYATMNRWRIDPWLYGDIRNLHLSYYIFYVVFFTNNLVVTNKQCIFAAEMLHSVIWEQIFIVPVCIINKSNNKNSAYGKDSR